MFNFSANHLLLLSRTEYRSCAVFLMQDRDTQRVYRTPQGPGRCDQQLVGRIAMERLWQLGGFHDDLRVEVQKRHARFRKGAFYPKPDGPIELQPSVLHKFRDFPTGDDANAEDAVGAMIREGRGASLAADPVEKPTRPKCGCPAESPQGVPVLACDRLQRLTELENRISQASAPCRGRMRLSRPPTLQPAGRAQMEVPPKRVRHARRQ
jgi:hypothetical protein